MSDVKKLRVGIQLNPNTAFKGGGDVSYDPKILLPNNLG
jgi:hypothetical protein